MKQVIVKVLKKVLKEKHLKLKDEEIENLLEIPPSLELGDFAFPCFVLASQLKQAPHEIAIELRAKLGNPPKGFEAITTQGPYVNFFVDRKKFSEKLIDEILDKKKIFGSSDLGKGINTMIEFSQANTHKAFHVGHIRGTSIGESLSRINEFFENKVTRANYQGDTGMHVAKWLWCYMKYHSKEKLVKDESWIASIYVDAVKRLDKNKRHYVEVVEINKRLELGIDKELNRLWKKTKKLSLNSLEKIYSELNTHFDVYYFESEMEKPGKKIAKNLVKKDVAKISDNATIVNLEKFNLGVWVLLRTDGTILYSAKDLALSEKKFKDYNLDKSIYVIANEQDLHMRQLLKTLELMGVKDGEKINHVSFGVVRLPKGKMSSRTGDNILYSDFIEEVTDYASKRIKERTSRILKKELEKRALVVSIAAIKYSMLKQTPNKNIIFKKEDALNFEGDTGPYILYSYARASSILRKVKIKKSKLSILEIGEKELTLVKKLSIFPEIVLRAYNNLNPAIVANYSYELAQTFNEFYHACPVIGSESEILRIKLVESFRIVLKNSLALLGIETLEEM